jgi:predicted GNAT superfamily acetyltransferase
VRPEHGAGDSCENRLVTTFRALTPSDASELVAINNDGYPGVPLSSAEELDALLTLSSVALGIVGDDGSLQGFLIALDPGVDYDSENYRFFETLYDNHLYIDRVVLASQLRGRGVGTELYERVFDLARSGERSRITCEVNLEPPNPGSLRFHRGLGFLDVDTQATKGGSVVVQLLQVPLSEGARNGDS